MPLTRFSGSGENPIGKAIRDALEAGAEYNPETMEYEPSANKSALGSAIASGIGASGEINPSDLMMQPGGLASVRTAKILAPKMKSAMEEISSAPGLKEIVASVGPRLPKQAARAIKQVVPYQDFLDAAEMSNLTTREAAGHFKKNVRGVTMRTPGERQSDIALNPEIAGRTTLPHEALHSVWKSLPEKVKIMYREHFKTLDPEVVSGISKTLNTQMYTPEELAAQTFGELLASSRYSTDLGKIKAQDPWIVHSIKKLKKQLKSGSEAAEVSASQGLHAQESFNAGEFVEFTTKEGKTIQGKVRDFDPNTGEVWIFHPETKLWDSPEAASTKVLAEKVKKL